MSSYDQLLHQVESLKAENSHLKMELKDNSSQLNKLDSVVGHLQSGKPGMGEDDLRAQITIHGLAMTTAAASATSSSAATSGAGPASSFQVNGGAMLPGKPHSLPTSLGTSGTDGNLRQTKDHFIRHQELERDRFVFVYLFFICICVFLLYYLVHV
ncbi:adenomatous polyposis coli protein 2-like [Strongylocentrotus purpuratus]|uniref:Adenomatous polyposis coli N-terminal dimerisation domain-containing protein n=1 Tax=Strongylocentrotus purpuratus TaxID=7668 RepID=A0A7M7N2P2_STRPU|nr:adenomatous polyposis coli protein 2-like [Strongylocentrotus purpuratus]